MANNFFNSANTIIGGQTARASTVDSEFDGVEAGFDGVETELKRGIKLPSGEATDHVLALTPAARANKILAFDANGDVVATQDIGTWRGAWATSVAYNARDLVSFGADGSIYVCAVAHTSTVFATDLGAGNWELIADFSGSLKITNQIIDNTDSPFSAVAGSDLMIDASSGAVTVTLPASPAIEDAPITITVLDRTNTITVARNGNVLMGGTTDLTVDVDNASFRLMWSNATFGWRLSNI